MIKYQKYQKVFLFMIFFLIILNVDIYGFYEDFAYKSYTVNDVTIPYRIYAPEGYDTMSYPLILYLHGAGERGTDNEAQLVGAPYFLFSDGFIINNPAIIIAPQCPDGQQWVDVAWTHGDYSTDELEETVYLHMVYEILLNVINEYNVDIDRVYITGLSMGGYAVWDMLIRYPDMFAAALPICGAGDSSKADLIKDIPIWAFHGEVDPVVPVSGVKKMMESFRALDSDNFKLTIYENGHHDAWTQTYKNTDVLKWMFRQSKAEKLEIKPTISEKVIESEMITEEKNVCDAWIIILFISLILMIFVLLFVVTIRFFKTL